MKNASRRITAVLFSFGFVCMAFCLRFALTNMAPASAPYIILFEFAALAGMGWAVVKAWQSTEAFTDREKRTFAALYCLYLTVNLLTAPVQIQIVTTALSTINQALAANTALCWTMQGIKLALPAAGVFFAFRTQGNSTVVFEEPAEPEHFDEEEAIEQLTVQLDEAEEQV